MKDLFKPPTTKDPTKLKSSVTGEKAANMKKI